MEVRVAPGETIESALRRFKKATQKAGVLAEARKHEHYEKPSVRRKKKSAAARKRRAGQNSRRAARDANPWRTAPLGPSRGGQS